MDQEINATNSNPMRARLQPKVKGYQSDMQKARRELQRAGTQASNATNRDDLFSGASQDYQVFFFFSLSHFFFHVYSPNELAITLTCRRRKCGRHGKRTLTQISKVIIFIV
jgi:hypothetical protein